MRELPLKATDRIKDYKGESFKPIFTGIFGVVDLPFLFPGRDLEQCADWAMRLWAEYHRKRGRLDKLYLFNYSGKRVYFAKSGMTYRGFLKWAFSYSNSYSLKMGCRRISSKELRPGDMIIQNKGGGIGHVTVILDVCIGEGGKRVFLAGYSFRPAQQMRVLRAPPLLGKEGWFTFKGLMIVLKPFSVFGRSVFRRFEEN